MISCQQNSYHVDTYSTILQKVVNSCNELVKVGQEIVHIQIDTHLAVGTLMQLLTTHTYIWHKTRNETPKRYVGYRSITYMYNLVTSQDTIAGNVSNILKDLLETDCKLLAVVYDTYRIRNDSRASQVTQACVFYTSDSDTSTTTCAKCKKNGTGVSWDCKEYA
jgi:hypothetical protein